MDRLTKRNSDGSVGINAFRYYNYQDFQKLTTRLADYEDIGTVEEFKKLKEKETHKNSIPIIDRNSLNDYWDY